MIYCIVIICQGKIIGKVILQSHKQYVTLYHIIAAHIMYEQGRRSNLESPGLTSLQHQVYLIIYIIYSIIHIYIIQANSYLVSLTLLKLSNSKYHWLLIPDNLQTTSE